MVTVPWELQQMATSSTNNDVVTEDPAVLTKPLMGITNRVTPKIDLVVLHFLEDIARRKHSQAGRGPEGSEKETVVDVP
jgi:hypothetical protein